MPASHAQAVEVLSIGCSEGNAEACSEAGRLVLRGPKQHHQQQQQPPAGDGGEPTLQQQQQPKKPARSPADIARADALFAQGCASGNTISNARCCGLRASLHLSPSLAPQLPAPAAPTDLLRWLELGCAGEHGASCLSLAAGYRSGGGAPLHLPRDPARAFALEVQGLQWLGMSPTAAARAVEKKHGPAPAAKQPA